MAASAAHIAELRDYIAEPTDDTYSDDDLSTVIEKYPLIDSSGNEPDETDWTATYDLNAAAANLWGRKASALAAMYDFKADGGDFKRSQLYENAKAQARYYGSRRMPSSFSVQTPRHFERDYQSTYWDSGEVTLEDTYIANVVPLDEDE
ncbi:MAG: hypothetical protein M0R22_13815 [Dehalococcoidia bacterium]|jgi:hypothetical protein|nr:hypothetical protein [Dehalococcoidia bacterium]